MTDAIIKRIKMLGLKKVHVAKNTGLSPTELSHFLHGRRPLSPEKITALKRYLNIV